MKEIPTTEWAMGFDFHISCPTFMFIRHHIQQPSFLRPGIWCILFLKQLWKFYWIYHWGKNPTPGENVLLEAGPDTSFHSCPGWDKLVCWWNIHLTSGEETLWGSELLPPVAQVPKFLLSFGSAKFGSFDSVGSSELRSAQGLRVMIKLSPSQK